VNIAGVRIAPRSGGYAHGMETGRNAATGMGRIDRPAHAVRLEFGRDPDAPRRARRLIGEIVDGPLGDDARLVTSELVTNVIQHTSSGGVMRAVDQRPNGPLRIEIGDADPTVPAPVRTPARGGRGLAIVDRVSARWGVQPIKGDGKVVWVELGP